MVDIDVREAEGGGYAVRVREADGESTHRVQVTDADVGWLGVEAAAEEILAESFRFLLEREPRRAILERFELRTISRYFPEYRKEMRRRLRA